MFIVYQSISAPFINHILNIWLEHTYLTPTFNFIWAVYYGCLFRSVSFLSQVFFSRICITEMYFQSCFILIIAQVALPIKCCHYYYCYYYYYLKWPTVFLMQSKVILHWSVASGFSLTDNCRSKYYTVNKLYRSLYI